MSSNNTIRLVSGGTLQVRTGVIQGLGPTGPQGATGATGPQAIFGTPVITGITYGSTPLASISGSGTFGSPYILNLSIPTQGPAFGTVTVNTITSGSATGSFSTNAQTGTTSLTLNIPAGAVGPSGASGTGFSDYKSLAGLKMTAVTTATATTSTTLNNTNGLAVNAMLVYFNTLGNPYTYGNWTITSGATSAVISGANATTGVINHGTITAFTVGASVTIQNATVTIDTTPSTPTIEYTATDQGLRYPTSLDVKPLTPYYLKQMATTVNTLLVSRFASAAARTTARGTRVDGEVTYLQDTDGLYVRQADGVDYPLAQVRIVTAIPTTGTYPVGTIFLKVG